MRYIPLVQVCDFQGGSQPPKDQWIDHEKEGYIRMLQIRDFTQPDKDNVEFVRISKTIKTCNEDDILIGRYGASVGKILTGLAGAYNVAIIKTIPVTSKLSKRFLYHYLNSPYFQNFILSVGSRAAQAGFNKNDLSDAQIPDLSLDDQSNVVSRLDKVSELIALRKEQLAKLDQLVKSRFIELFGEVETLIHKWDVKRFEEVTINLDSTRKPVKDADRQKMQGQYPYYGATGIVDYVNDYRIDGTFLLISEDGKALEFRNKDIAFIASGKIWVNNHAHVLQCTEDIEMIFLKYYMNFRNISDWVTGIDQKKLNRANMDKIPIGLPPITLQKLFATFVEHTDKSKLAIQQSLEKLELLKKSLMQEYFG